MLGRLRAVVKPIVRVIATPLARAGISPHHVTLSAIPLAFLAAIAVHFRAYGFALCFTLFAALADLLDGSVAELSGQTTPFGNYFETVVDKMVDVVLLAGAARGCPLATLLACGSSLLVSFAKARVGLVIVTDNRDWPTVGDRADRLLLWLVGLYLAWIGYRPLGLDALFAALWTLIAVNLVGLAQRLAYARKLIEEAERRSRLLPYVKRS